MKKQNSATVTFGYCFVIFILFFMFESCLRILSEFSVSSTTSIRSTPPPDKQRLELKSIRKWDPLLHPTHLQTLQLQGGQINCDRSHYSYDICSIHGPTVLDPMTSTFYLVDHATSTPPLLVEKIRPYPRKWESFVMKRIKEITITSGPGPGPGIRSPKCETQHNAPALVFSVAGYNGNFWHEFNDGFIPLFITVNSKFPDQDVIFVIDKARDWWVSKYAGLLKAFSKHPFVNLGNDNATHCFTSATLGLISHGFMTIDPTLLPNSATFTHFRALLDKAYGHGRNRPSMFYSSVTRPRLVLMSRKGSIGRVISNVDEVKRVAEEVGFDVIVFKPSVKTPLQEAYALINTSHVIVGVHGAALTHSLFLRPGSVLVQVVPLGLEWVADVCFAKSAKEMGVEYMEYKINAKESSLVEKYDENEMVIKDPVAFKGNNWSSDIMDIYLKEQNIKLDLLRFKEHLKQVYHKAKEFMDKEG
ncbi:hypothetical protein Dsin_009945 [Dipteronia sinensis]|uniref:Glycosyltransferase 61 catalytic domain-containing protein n=1 Tax=Dipteronia sinensis TaxID=43782 RepID=A0AAE0ASA1_9ROSI|nr:hypothetical protein Dsin_009945 [Dipteronia sinensis]